MFLIVTCFSDFRSLGVVLFFFRVSFFQRLSLSPFLVEKYRFARSGINGAVRVSSNSQTNVSNGRFSVENS